MHDERLAARSVRLLLKRDDLINADIPGNKCPKLKYNLEDAKASGARTLLTFGGAYSTTSAKSLRRATTSASPPSALSAEKSTRPSTRPSTTPSGTA